MKKKTTHRRTPAHALWQQCVEEIQGDRRMNFLQKGVAIAHILDRVHYCPPAGADDATGKKVFLSAARAAAFFWYPAELTEDETKERIFLHRFIIAGAKEPLDPPPFKKTCEGWTNFFRSAEQARQTYLSQFASSAPLKLHANFKSGFLPMENFLIIERWIDDAPDGVSLAHCTAELACEVISTFSNAGHDPKNFPRKKKQLGLVSYPKAELRGHIQHH
jgi:hypothetical protein